MAFGILGAHVWPVYVGVATDDPGAPPTADNEPLDDFDYARGQITWTPHSDGTITGTARIFAPKGVYTYLLFCMGPHREGFHSAQKMEHPFMFDRAGIIDINVGDETQLPRVPL